MRFTVFGGAGFIGSHLVSQLRAGGFDVVVPARDYCEGGRVGNGSLGHVISCIGLTQDFRSRLLDTVAAHVGVHLEILRSCEFDSITYLSSTRLYRGLPGPARETEPISLRPWESDDVYNASKVAGETLILAVAGERGRVVRLSNVYGLDQRDTFLAAILDEASQTARITLQTSLNSAKDYVSVEDVVKLLPQVALRGRGIYNIASGVNVTNAMLVEEIGRHTRCEVAVEPGAPTIVYPRIDVGRIREEFEFMPASVLTDIGPMLEAVRSPSVHSTH